MLNRNKLENVHVRDLKEIGNKFGVKARKKSDLINSLLEIGISEIEISEYPSLSDLLDFEDESGVTVEKRILAYKYAVENDKNLKVMEIGDKIRRELKVNVNPEILKKLPKFGVLYHEEIEAILKQKPELFFPSCEMRLYTGPWYDVDIVLIDKLNNYHLIEISYSSDSRMAIGQLLYYKKVFELKEKIDEVELVLITNQTNEIIEKVCYDLDILLIDISPESIHNKLDTLKRAKIKTIVNGSKSDKNGYRPDYIIE